MPAARSTLLVGRRALVTGGAAGIGWAIARALLEAGARVHIGDIDARALADLPAASGLSSSRADVADDADAADLVAAATRAMDGLDILVNDAGIAGPTALVEDIDPAAWRRTLEVDITGMFLVTRAAIPSLRAGAPASIVNLSSAAGRFGFARRSAYAAAKWAVVGFTRTLSIELGPFDINVNCLQPGPVPGRRLDAVMQHKGDALGVEVDDLISERLDAVSMGRFASADDVAAVACFLCTAGGHLISGQAIPVDGDQRTIV